MVVVVVVVVAVVVGVVSAFFSSLAKATESVSLEATIGEWKASLFVKAELLSVTCEGERTDKGSTVLKTTTGFSVATSVSDAAEWRMAGSDAATECSTVGDSSKV